MADVTRIFWRAVTGADFFNIERNRAAAPQGGGGQSYISISFAGLTYDELGEFLGVDPPSEIGTTRPTVTLPVTVLQDPAVQAPLTFRSRYRPPQPDDRYYIATQNRQYQKRHPAWTRRYGFPEAPDNVAGPHDAGVPDLTYLKVFVARLSDGTYAAGFFNSAQPPAVLAGVPEVAVLFEPFDPARSAGVITFPPGALSADTLAAATSEGDDLAVLAGTAPEVLAAVDETRLLAGRRPSGQGRRADAAERRAVELRAMDVATEWFRAQGWDVEDVSLYRSFDLLATRAGEEVHVEVKGTTGDGSAVLLTPGEVTHAGSGASLALAVVSGIALAADGEGAPVASGGTLDVVLPWDLDAHGELRPTGYEYRRRL